MSSQKRYAKAPQHGFASPVVAWTEPERLCALKSCVPYLRRAMLASAACLVRKVATTPPTTTATIGVLGTAKSMAVLDGS